MTGPDRPRLRPLRPDDVDRLAWLAAVAADAGCDAFADADAVQRSVGEGDLLTADGVPVALSCRRGVPSRGAAQIDFLAVAPNERRLGHGSRAALALEELLPPSVRRLYVAVPARLGLAFYFWLRLGYHPLTQRDWPSAPPQPPSVWMLREVG